MAEQSDMLGYGTGYVPQTKKIVEQVMEQVPDAIFEKVMAIVTADAKAQGVDMGFDSDGSQDILMEAVTDVVFAFVEKVRTAAAASDRDELHYMLFPF